MSIQLLSMIGGLVALVVLAVLAIFTLSIDDEPPLFRLARRARSRCRRDNAVQGRRYQMRNCARVVGDQYCGRPFITSRRVTAMTATTAIADLEYVVDLCQEHATEHDQDHL